MKLDGRISLSALMVAIFAGFVALAAGYAPEARLAPLVVGVPGLLLSLAQLARDIRDRMAARAGDGAGPEAGDRAPGSLPMILWFAAFVIASIGFGVVLAAPVLIFAFLRFDRGESLGLSLVIAISFAATIYLLFETVMGIGLPGGLVVEWLGLAGA